MSVIFGIIEDEIVIIAGDKRGSSKDGAQLTDDLSKVTVVNRHLAFASAGNASIGLALEIDTDKAVNRELMTTNDMLNTIIELYRKFEEAKTGFLLSLPFYFLIAGKSKDNTISLFSGGYINGKLDYLDVPMALYPPADTDMKNCSEIFVKNISFIEVFLSKRLLQKYLQKAN